MNNNQISISHGNVKMGAIPSVSLPPVITCPEGAPCAKKCYALRMTKRRASIKEAYARNFDIFNASPDSYFLQVRAAAITQRFFRFHVSGDIPNADYLRGMVQTARACKGTTFLAFTKQYNIVNNFLNAGGKLPKNLKLIFSEWGEGWSVPNPYNLPTAAVIFKGKEPREGWKLCGGNCQNCAAAGVGCWELRKGETIAFYEH